MHHHWYDRGDDAHQHERDDKQRDGLCTAIPRHLGPVLNFEQVSNDVSARPFQRNQLAEPVLRARSRFELGRLMLCDLQLSGLDELAWEARDRVPKRAVLP